MHGVCVCVCVLPRPSGHRCEWSRVEQTLSPWQPCVGDPQSRKELLSQSGDTTIWFQGCWRGKKAHYVKRLPPLSPHHTIHQSKKFQDTRHSQTITRGYRSYKSFSVQREVHSSWKWGLSTFHNHLKRFRAIWIIIWRKEEFLMQGRLETLEYGVNWPPATLVAKSNDYTSVIFVGGSDWNMKCTSIKRNI